MQENIEEHRPQPYRHPNLRRSLQSSRFKRKKLHISGLQYLFLQ